MPRRKRQRHRASIIEMLETTPARRARPLSTPGADEEIPDEELGWVPRELPRAVRSRRTFRIPVMVLALAAAAALYGAGHWLLRLPQAQADNRRSEYASELGRAADALPMLTLATDAITDPNRAEDLGPHLSALLGVRGLAEELTADGEPGLPLLAAIPGSDLESLDPLDDRAAAVADRLISLCDLLTDTALYRRSLEEMFLIPEPPEPDDGPSVDTLSDKLAEMTAATVSAAAILPDHNLFADHRASIDEMLAWLPDWQAVYLDALREGDVQGAGLLRQQAADRIEEIRAGLADPLQHAAEWARDELVRLEWDISAALTLTG